MFGMGLGELFFIAVIAILFLGPDKLPDTMVQIAKFFRSFKRTIDEAKNSLNEELRIKELKEEALKYKQQLDQASHQLEKTTHASLTSLDDLTDTVETVKESEAHLEEEVKELKEKVEPKREKITFPKKSKVAPKNPSETAEPSDKEAAAGSDVTKENHV
jgi:sec-independent protein translocase protein TatB